MIDKEYSGIDVTPMSMFIAVEPCGACIGIVTAVGSFIPSDRSVRIGDFVCYAMTDSICVGSENKRHLIHVDNIYGKIEAGD